MSAVKRLYTPEILGLAVELADHPLDPALPLQGKARSATCGSTLDLSLALDGDGRIAAIGARAQACAIGQASAALFLRLAVGLTATDIATDHRAMIRWLADEGALPDRAGLDVLGPARAFPARHGAILLPWQAALDALSPAAKPG